MTHRFEKQAEQLIILQRDREVTLKIRTLLAQKQKNLSQQQKARKWYEFWKFIYRFIKKG